MIKRDEAKEGGDGGGGGETSGAETPATPAVPANNSEAEASGDQFDELGYEKEPAKSDAPNEEGKGSKKPEPAAPAEPTKVEGTTGYGAEPPKVDPAAPPAADPAKADADKKAAEEAQTKELGFELKMEGLDEKDATNIKELVKKHKLSKEVAEALVQNRKLDYAADDKAFADAQEKEKSARTDTIAKWDKELRDDKTFGGENFIKNVAKVEKVLNDAFPETKKVLTQLGTVLPPYVMRDIAKLHDSMFGGAGSLVSGDPIPKKEDEDKSDDPLGFYE